MNTETVEAITRLSKDLVSAAQTLSHSEARFLVDAYYLMQDARIRANAQVRALGASGEPHDVLRWLAAQNDALEGQVKRALTKYAESQRLGEWALSVHGIGPIITAGLLAHIDIGKAPTVGHIWRFAGLDPTLKWEKKTRRPWNASLKSLCWKIGESFVKTSGNEEAFYGRIYQERKAYEIARNERGELAEQAAAALAAKRIGKDTPAYQAYHAGKLPPAHLHARAKRYAVKLFLAHYHEVGYQHLHGCAPPLPYPIAYLGHVHKIDPQPQRPESAIPSERATVHERTLYRERANRAERTTGEER